MSNSLRTYAPAIFSGIVLSLAYPRFNVAPLAWAALAPLLLSAADRSVQGAASRFFVAGWIFHTLLLQWLFANVYWAGGWAIIGQQLLCVILGLFWAVTGGAWSFIGTRLHLRGSAVLLAILWGSMEKLEETMFSGFGWSGLAYSQGPNLSLLQWASLGSVPLIGFFIALVNANLALIYARPRERLGRLATALAIVIGAHVVGGTMMDPPTYGDDPLNVGLLQANFSLEMKWDREYTVEMVETAAEKSAALASEFDVDLMIWPEALVTDAIDRPDLLGPIRQLVTRRNLYLFTGAVRYSRDGEAYNSSYVFRPDGFTGGRYDKLHLAPFGEYVPFSNYFPFIGQLVPAIGAIEPGTQNVVLTTRNRHMGPLICFEMLFPQMASDLRRRGADFLVVITNLAWFGKSSAIPQELDIARVRAIETRLPLVHCANTGISGVFDPYGRFTPIDIYAGRDGLYRLNPDVSPYQTIGWRLVGAMPLPLPGEGPLVTRSTLVPWVFVGTAILLFVAAMFFPPARSDTKT